MHVVQLQIAIAEFYSLQLSDNYIEPAMYVKLRSYVGD